METAEKVGTVWRQTSRWGIWKRRERFMAILTSDSLLLFRLRGSDQLWSLDEATSQIRQSAAAKRYRLEATSTCDAVPGDSHKFRLQALRVRVSDTLESTTLAAESETECSLWVIALSFRIQALAHLHPAQRADEPPQLVRNATSVLATQYNVPAANIRALVDMGFHAEQVARVLVMTETKSINEALDILLAHPDIASEGLAEAGADFSPAALSPGTRNDSRSRDALTNGSPTGLLWRQSMSGASSWGLQQHYQSRNLPAQHADNATLSAVVAAGSCVCSVCLEEVEESESAPGPVCGHRMHAACGRGYLEAKIRDGDVLAIRCPECPREFTAAEITAWVQDATARRFQELHARRVLEADPTVRWCQRPGCERAMRGFEQVGLEAEGQVSRTLKAGMTAGLAYCATIGMAAWTPYLVEYGRWQACLGGLCAVVCAVRSLSIIDTRDGKRVRSREVVGRVSKCECGFKLCYDCKQAWHPGVRCEDAAEDKEQRELRVWADQHDAGKCPRCQCPIERIDGCNHMTCKCGHEFCWLCGQPYRDGCIRSGRCQQYGGRRVNVDINMAAGGTAGVATDGGAGWRVGRAGCLLAAAGIVALQHRASLASLVQSFEADQAIPAIEEASVAQSSSSQTVLSVILLELATVSLCWFVRNVVCQGRARHNDAFFRWPFNPFIPHTWPLVFGRGVHDCQLAIPPMYYVVVLCAAVCHSTWSSLVSMLGRAVVCYDTSKQAYLLGWLGYSFSPSCGWSVVVCSLGAVGLSLWAWHTSGTRSRQSRAVLFVATGALVLRRPIIWLLGFCGNVNQVLLLAAAKSAQDYTTSHLLQPDMGRPMQVISWQYDRADTSQWAAYAVRFSNYVRVLRVFATMDFISKNQPLPDDWDWGITAYRSFFLTLVWGSTLKAVIWSPPQPERTRRSAGRSALALCGLIISHMLVEWMNCNMFAANTHPIIAPAQETAASAAAESWIIDNGKGVTTGMVQLMMEATRLGLHGVAVYMLPTWLWDQPLIS